MQGLSDRDPDQILRTGAGPNRSGSLNVTDVVHMADEKYLKEDLIELRKELGLTQREMADRLHMALRSYQAIEGGESEYRFIHRLAAERVALMIAVEKKDPMLAPLSLRQDAIELVRVGELTGNRVFGRNRKSGASHAQAAENAGNAQFRAAYGVSAQDRNDTLRAK
jgi:transcriptional regulator with XRE-family HTH domain